LRGECKRGSTGRKEGVLTDKIGTDKASERERERRARESLRGRGGGGG
jgi:hypothetical protein